MFKYLKIVKLSLIDRLAYRQELLSSLLIGMLVFCGQYVFWSAVFSETDMVGGFTYKQMLLYFLFVRIISEVVDSRLSFRINDMILDGTISNLLMKPIKIKLFLIFQDLGVIFIDIIVKMIMYLVIFVLVFRGFDLEVGNFLLFIFSFGLSIIINFNLALMMGMLAFKIDNASALIYAFRRVILFLSGGIIPIVIFPILFQNILTFLPFKYIIDLPISFLLNRIEPNQTWKGLLIQLSWGIVMWVFTGFLLSRAIKNNESVGI